MFHISPSGMGDHEQVSMRRPSEASILDTSLSPTERYKLISVAPFREILASKRTYSFGVTDGESRKILQIDVESKLICLSVRGRIEHSLAFDDLVTFDQTDEGFGVKIVFTNKNFEVEVDTVEESHALCRLLSAILERVDLRKMGVHPDTQDGRRESPQDALSLAPAPTYIKEGILLKRGNTALPVWAKRHVKVKQGEFSYFKPNEDQPLNIVQLWESNCEIKESLTNGFSIYMNNRKYAFRVLSDKKQGQEERDEWIKCLRRACRSKRTTMILLASKNASLKRKKKHSKSPTPSSATVKTHMSDGSDYTISDELTDSVEKHTTKPFEASEKPKARKSSLKMKLKSSLWKKDRKTITEELNKSPLVEEKVIGRKSGEKHDVIVQSEDIVEEIVDDQIQESDDSESIASVTVYGHGADDTDFKKANKNLNLPLECEVDISDSDSPSSGLNVSFDSLSENDVSTELSRLNEESIENELEQSLKSLDSLLGNGNTDEPDLPKWLKSKYIAPRFKRLESQESLLEYEEQFAEENVNDVRKAEEKIEENRKFHEKLQEEHRKREELQKDVEKAMKPRPVPLPRRKKLSDSASPTMVRMQHILENPDDVFSNSSNEHSPEITRDFKMNYKRAESNANVLDDKPVFPSIAPSRGGEPLTQEDIYENTKDDLKEDNFQANNIQENGDSIYDSPSRIVKTVEPENIHEHKVLEASKKVEDDAEPVYENISSIMDHMKEDDTPVESEEEVLEIPEIPENSSKQVAVSQVNVENMYDKVGAIPKGVAETEIICDKEVVEEIVEKDDNVEIIAEDIEEDIDESKPEENEDHVEIQDKIENQETSEHVNENVQSSVASVEDSTRKSSDVTIEKLKDAKDQIAEYVEETEHTDTSIHKFAGTEGAHNENIEAIQIDEQIEDIIIKTDIQDTIIDEVCKKEDTAKIQQEPEKQIDINENEVQLSDLDANKNEDKTEDTSDIKENDQTEEKDKIEESVAVENKTEDKIIEDANKIENETKDKVHDANNIERKTSDKTEMPISNETLVETEETIKPENEDTDKVDDTEIFRNKQPRQKSSTKSFKLRSKELFAQKLSKLIISPPHPIARPPAPPTSPPPHPVGSPPPPPPPPPPGIGTPVPPPPPTPAKEVVPAKYKRFHWSALTDRQVSGSIWDIKEKRTINKLDEKLIEEQFGTANQPVAPIPAITESGGSGKHKPTILLSSKRAQNVAIFLRGFSLHGEDLTDNLCRLREEESDITMGQLRSIKRYKPTADDREMYRPYQQLKTTSTLHTVDQFMVELIEINELDLRVDLLLSLWEFPERIHSLFPTYELLSGCYDQLLKSTKFISVLFYLLDLGNFLNCTQRDTKGFQLSTLSNLTDLKGNHRPYTLLYCLVQNIGTHHPELLTFTSELTNVSKCKDISIKALTAEVDVLRIDLEKIKKSVRTLKKKLKKPTNAEKQFLESIQSEINDHEKLIADTQKTNASVNNLYQQTMMRFAQTRQMESPQFLEPIIEFMDKFDSLRKQLIH